MASKTALKDARDRAGWTNRELGRRSGVSEKIVSLMCRGFWGTSADRARVRAVLGGELRDLFPHVPAAELKRAAYINALTSELYPTTGPPVAEAPRIVQDKSSGAVVPISSRGVGGSN